MPKKESILLVLFALLIVQQSELKWKRTLIANVEASSGRGGRGRAWMGSTDERSSHRGRGRSLSAQAQPFVPQTQTGAYNPTISSIQHQNSSNQINPQGTYSL